MANNDGLIKSSAPLELNSEQKAKLNRRANELFNSGDVVSAGKIFATTGYSAGLTRVGDYYMQQNDKLTALHYYILAKNTNNADILINEVTQVVRMLLSEE